MNIATSPIPLRRSARLNAGLFEEMVVDNFAGGGGASRGIEAAIGRSVDVAINHDQDAVRTHALKDYILTGPKWLQVKLIGNSVCPQMAEAIVRANYTEKAEVAA